MKTKTKAPAPRTSPYQPTAHRCVWYRGHKWRVIGAYQDELHAIRSASRGGMAQAWIKRANAKGID